MVGDSLPSRVHHTLFDRGGMSGGSQDYQDIVNEEIPQSIPSYQETDVARRFGGLPIYRPRLPARRQGTRFLFPQTLPSLYDNQKFINTDLPLQDH